DRATRAVRDAMADGIHGADGDYFGAISGKWNAAFRCSVAQTAAERNEVKGARIAARLPDPDLVSPATVWIELDHGATSPGSGLCERAADFLVRRSVEHTQIKIGGRGPAEFNRNRIAAPGNHFIIHDAVRPLMPAIMCRVEGPGPVALGGVAGARAADHVARVCAVPEELRQGLVDRSAAFAVAPAGHDHRAG